MRLRGLIAPFAGAVVLLGLCASPAAATAGAPGGPTNAEIQAARTKASELAQLISTDNENEQIAAEHFDQANIMVGLDLKRVANLRARIRWENRAIVAGRRRVQAAAIQTYVDGDITSAQFSGLLASSLTDAESLTTYAEVATTSLHSAVVRLGEERARLVASEAAARTAAADAHAAALSATAARDEASAAQQSTASALSAVRGRLATLIEQRALAIAEAKAAAARAAKSAAARNEDAESAVENFNLANDLGGSDPAVAEAEAAQAAYASEVGHPALVPAGSTVAGDLAVHTAESYLGVPYVWGGAGPTGFDCSGLTMVAWAAAGVALTHSAWYQYRETQHVALSDIEPGDLLFYSFPDDGPDPVTHVAMYVGSGPYGAETIIQAPETGETVSYSPMYYFGFVGAGQP